MGVRMETVKLGEEDGLVIGITSINPSTFNDPFMVAEEVPSSWSFGYDGRMFKLDVEEEITWNPAKLAKDDHVGLLLTPTGAAHVYVNGHVVVDTPLDIPKGSNLYGFIDLLGSATSVSLVASALPPKTT